MKLHAEIARKGITHVGDRLRVISTIAVGIQWLVTVSDTNKPWFQAAMHSCRDQGHSLVRMIGSAWLQALQVRPSQDIEAEHYCQEHR